MIWANAPCVAHFPNSIILISVWGWRGSIEWGGEDWTPSSFRDDLKGGKDLIVGFGGVLYWENRKNPPLALFQPWSHSPFLRFPITVTHLVGIPDFLYMRKKTDLPNLKREVVFFKLACYISIIKSQNFVSAKQFQRHTLYLLCVCVCHLRTMRERDCHTGVSASSDTCFCWIYPLRSVLRRLFTLHTYYVVHCASLYWTKFLPFMKSVLLPVGGNNTTLIRTKVF